MRLKLSPALVLYCVPLALGWMWSTPPSAVLGKSFKACVTSSSKAWKSKSYSACIAELEQAIQFCKDEQLELIQGLLPRAPKGWKVIPEGKAKDSEWDVGGGIFASVGVFMRDAPGRDYSNKGGGSTLRLRISSDSQMTTLLRLTSEMPGLLEGNQEALTFGSETAILCVKGADLELHVPFGEKGLLVATLRNGDRDFLLGFIDVKLLASIESVLGK